MAAGPGAAESTGMDQAEGAPARQLPAGPRSLPCAAPTAALPTRKPALRSTSPCPLRAAAAQGWGARSERDLGIPGRTEGAAGHRADLDPAGAAPQPVLPAPDPDCDPRRPPPSAEACARQAATPEPPGPPPPPPRGGAPGAPRASPTSRQSCSRARASSRLLADVWARVPPGRPRGPSAPAAPASPALPDVARCSPAAGQPPSPRLRPLLAPRLPRGPAPAPASPLPRGRPPASLVTREQLRPESPGLAGEGEASPPPGQGHEAPTGKARAGRRTPGFPGPPEDGGAAQSCPEAETRPSVKMAFGRLPPPPRMSREPRTSRSGPVRAPAPIPEPAESGALGGARVNTSRKPLASRPSILG